MRREQVDLRRLAAAGAALAAEAKRQQTSEDVEARPPTSTPKSAETGEAA